ncbi:MAG TPA: PP2C family protein-serine/threonine phosphatase [Thermoanaerobaculia bacterium]|nr:PP2C family protein-serine/threonine phosphatase [Thermoanaerobaculia bacterium]
MRQSRNVLLWVLAAAAGLPLFMWAYPRAFPFTPGSWSITRYEAGGIALERLRDLGDPVEDPYVVTSLATNPFFERRLQLALREGVRREQVQATGFPDLVAYWQVAVYSADALRDDWTYLAEVALDGEVKSLRLRLDPRAPGAPISEVEARNRADAFLASQGIDLSLYGEPQLRSTQLTARTDLAVRYPDRRGGLGKDVSFGVEVLFAGDRLAGFRPWMDDPQAREIQRALRPLQVTRYAWVMGVIVLVLVLALPFLRRYHAGEIGVRRAVQIFVLVGGGGLLTMLLVARASSQDLGLGVVSRAQTTWLYALFGLMFNVIPVALLGFFTWAVGESICRERWGRKLAAFDALFQRQWRNSTVARSSLAGWSAGLLMSGLLAALLVLLQRWDVWPLIAGTVGLQSGWPGLELLADSVCESLPFFMLVTICILPWAARWLGRVLGVVAAVLVGALVIFPPTLPLPLGPGVPVLLFVPAAVVAVFLIVDLLAALTAGAVMTALFAGYYLLTADDPALQVQGALALAALSAPLLASLRHLASDQEFVYRYEDVPPHVRRIAERERQRVELETARRIQSSILPELPPRIAGVDIAHAYLPASEVGGDFYDVLALEDGRLAVAVGDVAGHGVSSGLVMSMAKSALAVQVTFNPEVAAVFRTLNRTIYQTARKRLLATLCYALLDPKQRELLYASAGHLYPYRITAAGKVEALESTAYPLGVRGELQVDPRVAKLEPGDTLFLFSDGLVEARPEGSEEMFGFERLERSLSSHAGESVEQLRDGILADIARFTGQAPREDDQTVLVLRLPAA